MVLLRSHEEERCRLKIAAGAEWFQIGEGSPVFLETRLPLRRLLLALADLRINSPNGVLPVTAAFDAGWPGERASPTAAAMRVYTAVHSLRRLGLRGLLIRRRRGYVLDADISISHASLIPPPLDPAGRTNLLDPQGRTNLVEQRIITESQVTETVKLRLADDDIAHTG